MNPPEFHTPSAEAGPPHRGCLAMAAFLRCAIAGKGVHDIDRVHRD